MVRTASLAVLALACSLLGFSLVGTAPASASSTELCSSILLGEETHTFFKDNECKIPDETFGKWHRVITGGTRFTRLFFASAQQFNGTFANTAVAFTCSTLTNSAGSAENFEEAGIQKVKGKEMVLQFGGCSITEPAACKIPATITTQKLKSLAFPEGGVSKVRFEPESGTTIFSLVISGCSLAETAPVKGSFTGIVPTGEESVIEFSSKSGSALKLGANALTYAGSTESEDESTGDVIFIGL